MINQESFEELIANDLSFKNKIDNLLEYLGSGLISFKEHDQLMKQVIKQAETNSLTNTMLLKIVQSLPLEDLNTC